MSSETSHSVENTYSSLVDISRLPYAVFYFLCAISEDTQFQQVSILQVFPSVVSDARHTSVPCPLWNDEITLHFDFGPH